jgi:Mce-associated membrane protein
VLSLEDDRGEVLFFVDQTVTNNNVDQPKIERLRMRMGLEKQSGRWMINKLDLV